MKKDITNQKFGRLTAKEIVRTIPGKGTIWQCECECGGEKEVPAAYLLNGHTKSCGCLNAERHACLDITGQRWGRLVAIRHVGYTTTEHSGKRQAVWLWQCDCGNTKEIPATQVKHGGTRSCGCKAIEHITAFRKQDITGERFGRLIAICPTDERDANGSVIWKMQCDCGNITYKTINALKSGRVLSCGCLYADTRKETIKARRDLIESTSLSSLILSKKLNKRNKSGFTGVWFNRRTEKWEAIINFKKTRYYLGRFDNIADAIDAREKAEKEIHDPMIFQHLEKLTESRRKEFLLYLHQKK